MDSAARSNWRFSAASSISFFICTTRSCFCSFVRYFTTGSAAVEFVASLVWNVEIDPGRSSDFNQAAVLYDLDLRLFDVTGGGQVSAGV